MPAGFYNLWVLASANALAFCAVPLLVFAGSLIGAELSGSTSLATLPIAAMVIGTAVGTVPASMIMKRFGRKRGLLGYMLLGFCACLLSSAAIAGASFLLYCASTAMLGVCAAALQQVRFAAMESVAPEHGPTAISFVLAGGIVAAVIGPEIALRGRNLTDLAYQGSYWLAAGFLLAAALVLLLLRPYTQTHSQAPGAARPFTAIAANPRFWLAVATASVGYAVMTFMMTATPISMHHHYHHSLADTKWVIQSHIAAMFLPSLVSPWLIRRLGAGGMIKAGLGAYVATLLMGYASTSVASFWVQLVLLGIGWNFLFVAGTVLLPQSYRPGEQFKAQACNDAFVFSIQAVASLSSGWVISHGSWQTVLGTCILPMVLLLGVMAWNRASGGREAAGEPAKEEVA